MAPCQLGHHHGEIWVFPCALIAAGSPFPDSLGWALAHVLFLNEKAWIPSHCTLLIKALSNKSTGHGGGGQGRVQGAKAPLPVVVRRKSHVSGLTHFPGWPGALVGRRWKETSEGSEPSGYLSFPWAGSH